MLIVLLILEFVVAVFLWALLEFPFAFAEPGQAHGWGPTALLWGVGELGWTIWVFFRRRREPILRGTRWAAFAIVSAGLAAACAIGPFLQDRREYDAGAWVSAVLLMVGCRAGRYYLTHAK